MIERLRRERGGFLFGKCGMERGFKDSINRRGKEGYDDSWLGLVGEPAVRTYTTRILGLKCLDQR